MRKFTLLVAALAVTFGAASAMACDRNGSAAGTDSAAISSTPIVPRSEAERCGPVSRSHCTT